MIEPIIVTIRWHNTCYLPYLRAISGHSIYLQDSASVYTEHTSRRFNDLKEIY